MTRLDPGFLACPIAHRALHDQRAGRPENSRAAIEAACVAGYSIEIDVQPSADAVPMVFHDPTLDRMTDRAGPINAVTAAALGQIQLHGTTETIPTLADVLTLIDGRVPVVVEIKDQGGDPRHDTHALVDLTLDALSQYGGPFALMSFNPFAVAYGAARRPDLTWGLTTGASKPLWSDHPDLDAALIQSPIDPRDYGASFMSHNLAKGTALLLSGLRDVDFPILAWTIRSPQDAQRAASYAANITFEGYLPELTALGA